LRIFECVMRLQIEDGGALGSRRLSDALWGLLQRLRYGLVVANGRSFP
jgi:hypothetical protein